MPKQAYTTNPGITHNRNTFDTVCFDAASVGFVNKIKYTKLDKTKTVMTDWPLRATMGRIQHKKNSSQDQGHFNGHANL